MTQKCLKATIRRLRKARIAPLETNIVIAQNGTFVYWETRGDLVMAKVLDEKEKRSALREMGYWMR
jgi:hypothetical protein